MPGCFVVRSERRERERVRHLFGSSVDSGRLTVGQRETVLGPGPVARSSSWRKEADLPPTYALRHLPDRRCPSIHRCAHIMSKAQLLTLLYPTYRFQSSTDQVSFLSPFDCHSSDNKLCFSWLTPDSADGCICLTPYSSSMRVYKHFVSAQFSCWSLSRHE